VANVLGLVPIELVRDILTTLNLGKTDEMINKLQIAYTQAFSPAQLAQQLTDALREQPIYNLDNVGLLEDLLLVSPAYDPLVKLETVLIRHSLEKNTVTDTQKTPESELEKTDQYNVQPEIVIDNQVKSSQTDVSQFGVSDTARLSDEHLKGLLDGVKNHNKSLYSVLRLAKPYLKDKQLNLEFNFPFHKQRADENRNKRLIEQIASEVLNQDIIVRTIIVPSGPTSDTPKNRDDFSDVINVMGGGSPVEYTDG
jgi:hypothetical protein